jgi:cephalosporin hydroxylase
VKIIIDTDELIIQTRNGGNEVDIPLYSQEGFRLLSSIWIKQEWNQLHWQTFSWFGFPVWQFPDDLLRLQEIIVALRPDVIVETGVSQGGSSIFFATLCRLLGKGRVVSVDIVVPADLRARIEQSPFGDLITLIQGDSTSTAVVEKVREHTKSDSKVFVFLDSDHSKSHVMEELNAYADMVTPGSYIVAADGVMQHLADTPWGKAEWIDDNPATAAREFVAAHPEFVIKRPPALCGNEHVIEELTYWPDAWIYRLPD